MSDDDLDGLEAVAFLDARYTPAGGPAVAVKVLELADERADVIGGAPVVQVKSAFALPVRLVATRPAKGAALVMLDANGNPTAEAYTLSSAATYTDADRAYWRCSVNPA